MPTPSLSIVTPPYKSIILIERYVSSFPLSTNTSGTVFEVRKSQTDAEGSIEVLVYDGKVAVGLEGKEPALYEAGEYTQFTAPAPAPLSLLLQLPLSQ